MKKPAALSAKHVALGKANTSLIIIISVSIFITIFSMVAIKNLFAQMKYQHRVISAKKVTLEQTKKNIIEEEKLAKSYQEFASSTANIIGGNPKGNGDRDGDNGKIVLDALPSKYDFPALTSGIDKLAKIGGFTLTSITGTDDEANQASNISSSNPTPVDIPFIVESDVLPSDAKRFLQLFELSIRPIQVSKLEILSKDDKVTVTINAKTYYQPEKKLNVTEEIVR